MDILYYTAYYASLFIIPFVVYMLIFRKSRVSVYSGKDWMYLPKFYIAKREVEKRQEKCKKLIKKIGLGMESEICVSPLYSTDSQMFYGVDELGNLISFKLEIGIDNIAEASLHLRLKDGNAYMFPGEKGIYQTNLPKKLWKIAGFNVEILEPYKRIRITFNGLLKNISVTDFEKIEHIRFNFIFTCLGSPHYIPQDINSSLYASAIAREHWRDGSWKDNVIEQLGFVSFGAMKGFIKGDSYPEEVILNFPSTRSRQKGISDRFLLRRMIQIMATDEYGNMFNIISKSFTKRCSQLNYGFAYLSTEKRYPITDVDLNLHLIGENKTFPDCIKTNIVANGKTYIVVIYLNKDKILKSVNEDEYGYEYYTFSAECNINLFSGTALVEFYYEKDGKGMYIPSKKLTEKYVIQLPLMFVTDIHDEESQILELTGGKGNSLALLSTLNSDCFTIPDGFIITVQAYKHQLSKNITLTVLISKLNDICCGKTEGNLEEICKDVVNSFKNSDVTTKIQETIINQLKKYSENCQYSGWAVRSSALGEDSEELSAAGQNDTFLGCQTELDILKAVKACWASLYTYQSVQYRWQHGLPVITDMAVVVQKMVKSDSAGVLFTCHPSTLNPSEMVITSNFGLGETVVSGKSDPDTYILNRTWDGKICVIHKALGTKNKVLKVTSTGLEEITTQENSRESWSLSDKQAIEVGKVGVYLEQAFGNPRDIEWAFYKDKLYLLQSRAITTLNSWSDFELCHEMDSPIRTKKALFTTANVREVIPKAVTVLSHSTTVKSIDWAMQKFAQRNFDPLTCRGLITHQHNMLLDAFMTLYKNIRAEVHVSSSILDLAVFGHPVLDERLNEIAINRMGITPKFFQINEPIRIMKNAWKDIALNAEQIVDKLNLCFDEDEYPKLIYEKIDDSLGDLVDVALCHSKTSAVSVFYQVIAMNILLEGKTELTSDHISDFASILSSCEDVISVEVPKYLEEIANIIKEAKQSEVFSKVNPTEGVEWLKYNCHRAYEVFTEFLEKHGHRNLGEFEIMEESWRENPSIIMSMIQANLQTERKKKETISLNKIMTSLKSPKKSSTRSVIKFFVKKIRVAVCSREKTKSEMIRGFDQLRQAYRILGRQMVVNGLLPSKDLIYHLTHKEIGSIIENRNPSLITKAIRRHKLYPTWQKLRFPEIMEGEPKPEDDSNILVDNLTGICKGTQVCTGIVQARACVIHSLDEIDQLQPGDILITYSTDIGWSPYFPMLSGIVTELGGLVSHGAVVAREYGLPCIVGVKNVTKYFKTGDNVQLNGNKGEIGKMD